MSAQQHKSSNVNNNSDPQANTKANGPNGPSSTVNGYNGRSHGHMVTPSSKKNSSGAVMGNGISANGGLLIIKKSAVTVNGGNITGTVGSKSPNKQNTNNNSNIQSSPQKLKISSPMVISCELGSNQEYEDGSNYDVSGFDGIKIIQGTAIYAQKSPKQKRDRVLQMIASPQQQQLQSTPQNSKLQYSSPNIKVQTSSAPSKKNQHQDRRQSSSQAPSLSFNRQFYQDSPMPNARAESGFSEAVGNIEQGGQKSPRRSKFNPHHNANSQKTSIPLDISNFQENACSNNIDANQLRSKTSNAQRIEVDSPHPHSNSYKQLSFNLQVCSQPMGTTQQYQINQQEIYNGPQRIESSIVGIRGRSGSTTAKFQNKIELANNNTTNNNNTYQKSNTSSLGNRMITRLPAANASSSPTKDAVFQLPDVRSKSKTGGYDSPTKVQETTFNSASASSPISKNKRLQTTNNHNLLQNSQNLGNNTSQLRRKLPGSNFIEQPNQTQVAFQGEELSFNGQSAKVGSENRLNGLLNKLFQNSGTTAATVLQNSSNSPIKTQTYFYNSNFKQQPLLFNNETLGKAVNNSNASGSQYQDLIQLQQLQQYQQQQQQLQTNQSSNSNNSRKIELIASHTNDDEHNNKIPTKMSTVSKNQIRALKQVIKERHSYSEKETLSQNDNPPNKQQFFPESLGELRYINSTNTQNFYKHKQSYQPGHLQQNHYENRNSKQHFMSLDNSMHLNNKNKQNKMHEENSPEERSPIRKQQSTFLHKNDNYLQMFQDASAQDTDNSIQHLENANIYNIDTQENIQLLKQRIRAQSQVQCVGTSTVSQLPPRQNDDGDINDQNSNSQKRAKKVKRKRQQQVQVVDGESSPKKNESPQKIAVMMVNGINSNEELQFKQNDKIEPKQIQKIIASGINSDKNSERAQINRQLKQNGLNIQKIQVPKYSPAQPNSATNNSASPSRRVTQVPPTQQQSQSPKKQLQMRKQAANEKCLPPLTAQKCGITKRMLFRRRERMRDSNLIVIYFDGVVGDTNGQQLYNNYRVRAGAFAGLRRLYQTSQIALILPYVRKRAQVIATHIEKYHGCPVDAIYVLKRKLACNNTDHQYRYKQIYQDFELDEEEKLISNCLILASYNQEICDQDQFKQEFSNLNPLLGTDQANPVRCTLQLGGCSALSGQESRDNGSSVDVNNIATLSSSPTHKSSPALPDASNKANPVTILVPHLNLETNNCTFPQIQKYIEKIRLIYKERISRDLAAASLTSLFESNSSTKETSSIDLAESPLRIEIVANAAATKHHHDITKVNFLEAFYMVEEEIAQGNADLKHFHQVETKDLQTRLYQNEMCAKILKDKQTKKKCTLMQQKYQNSVGNVVIQTYEDRYPHIWQMYSFQSMLASNLGLKNSYISAFQKQYLSEVEDFTADIVMKVSPMPEAEMIQHIRITDIPCPSVNYFSSHRFFVVKGFQCMGGTQYNAQNLFEYVSVQRDLGEFVPNEIEQSIANQHQFDVVSWLCKKLFARPMPQQSVVRNKGSVIAET